MLQSQKGLILRANFNKISGTSRLLGGAIASLARASLSLACIYATIWSKRSSLPPLRGSCSSRHIKLQQETETLSYPNDSTNYTRMNEARIFHSRTNRETKTTKYTSAWENGRDLAAERAQRRGYLSRECCQYLKLVTGRMAYF